jgi:hypothetical protein
MNDSMASCSSPSNFAARPGVHRVKEEAAAHLVPLYCGSDAPGRLLTGSSLAQRRIGAGPSRPSGLKRFGVSDYDECGRESGLPIRELRIR